MAAIERDRSETPVNAVEITASHDDRNKGGGARLWPNEPISKVQLDQQEITMG